jgi:hypothetical protein
MTAILSNPSFSPNVDQQLVFSREMTQELYKPLLFFLCQPLLLRKIDNTHNFEMRR